MGRPRSPLKSLASALDRSGGLVALFDQRRRLVYASKAVGDWLGVSVDKLLRREVRYTSEPQADAASAAVAALAPPPQAFGGERCQRRLISPPSGGEELEALFLPLRLSESEAAVLLISLGRAEDAAEPGGDSADWHAAIQALRSRWPVAMQIPYLVGESAAMRRVRSQVQLAASSRARVVVVGEKGCGIEEIARVIQGQSGARADGLIPIDCPIQDAESLQATIRLLARRRSGTSPAPLPGLMLRDIGALAADAQNELLGFLKLPGFDIRTLATSHAPLEKLVRKRRFSRELATELATLEIRVPPLRKRLEDLPILAHWLLERINARGGVQYSGLVPDALERLIVYSWPENVDELSQVVEHAAGRSAGPWLIASDFPERLRSAWLDLAHPRPAEETLQLDEFLAEIERELLQRALQQSRGNKAKAARLLGVSRPRLLRRLVQLGIISPAEEAIDFEPIGEEAAIKEPLHE